MLDWGGSKATGALSTEHPLRTGSGQSAIGTWCSSVVQPSTGTWCDQGGSSVRDPSSAGGTAVARRTVLSTGRVGSGQRAAGEPRMDPRIWSDGTWRWRAGGRPGQKGHEVGGWRMEGESRYTPPDWNLPGYL